MAYEKVELIVAGLSGDIFMAETNDDGLMSLARRNVTDECLKATTEWFMRNNRKMIGYSEQGDGTKPTLFFACDSEKAKRILEILQEK